MIRDSDQAFHIAKLWTHAKTGLTLNLTLKSLAVLNSASSRPGYTIKRFGRGKMHESQKLFRQRYTSSAVGRACYVAA
ncbi:MAG TPA: hypothetical protein DGG94_22055 [Micromonosporaceae bacterium]|nr:hypothetical protein [Micromonosporaceae bacterium]HCU52443.1 hypothetical protein [Micromonosporaceae bacterium]